MCEREEGAVKEKEGSCRSLLTSLLLIFAIAEKRKKRLGALATSDQKRRP